MLWASQMTFFLVNVVLGAPTNVLTETKETILDSNFQNMIQNIGTQKGSEKRQFQCRWNCQIVDSDLGNIIQLTVITEGRKLRLAFHYEKIVEDDCASRTSRNSNGSLTEYWQVWLVNNTLSSIGGNVIRGFSTLIQASFEDQIKVLCRFRKTNSPREETLYDELSSPSEQLENILRSTVRSLGKVCDAQTEADTQTCIQISKFIHSAQWKDFVLHGLTTAFVIAFTYIGPAVVCIYSATEDTCDGNCQINVEGPSSTEYTIWYRARKFIVHVGVLPIPFLAPAIFVEYFVYQNLVPDQNMLGISLTVPPFRILCYGCFYFNAFYLHILRGKPPDKERPCDVIAELPQRMLRHLHMVGSTLTLLCSLCVNLFNDICRGRSSSPILVRFFYATFSLVLIPVVIVYGFLWFKFLIIMSFPIATVWAATQIVSQSEILQPICTHGLLKF